MSRDFDSLHDKLLRELGEGELTSSKMEWTEEFAFILNADDQTFRKLGLDTAVWLGTLGDWPTAHSCIRRFRSLESGNTSALIFEMRCLFELESFTEVLALGQRQLSEKQHLLTANYLMAQSFEALEMFPQARSRYEAVIRQEANFLDASLRLAKLQGFPS